MSLADQINALEHDHAEALAKIASLTADRDSLKTQNVAIVAELAAVRQINDEVTQWAGDTRALAEKLGADALELLRQSRRETFKPAEIAKYAPKQAELKPDVDAIRAMVAEDHARPFIARTTASTPEFQAMLGDQSLVNPEYKTRTVVELSPAPEGTPIPDFLRRDAVFGQGPRAAVSA